MQSETSRAPGGDVVVSPPRYALVAQTLIDDIRRGRYPVGDRLPPEVELCQQFGVSRHTLREAMRQLLDRGLITRQRGVGTLVRASRAEPRYVQSITSIGDLPQYVEDTRLVTVSAGDVIADEHLATRLGCRPGQRWMHVRGRRYAGDDKDPIALTDIYLNAPYAGIRKLIGVQKVPVYTLIEKQYGETVVEVRQRIGASVIGDDDARELNVAPGSAGLVIVRHYLGQQDRLLEVAVNLHPAERFSYSMALRMKPAQAP